MQNQSSLSDSQESSDFWRQKSRFISHEIKNQLSIINLYAKIIEKKNDGDKSVENSIQTIFNAVSSITDLLQELKSVSEINFEKCGLRTLVGEVIAETDALAKENDIKLENTVTADDCIFVDKQKFKNVLLNLIKNATEAFDMSDKKGKYIRLSACEINNTILLRIENNGNKIDKKNQLNIFKEGFTTKKTGSGLGLCICRKTLAEQNCDLSLLKSDKNQTVFEIKISKS